MRFRHALLASLCILIAACVTPADGGFSATTTTVTTAPNVEPTTTSDGGGITTTQSGGSTTVPSGREIAPDFTLQLGDGSAFTLSEAGKPVYLVFWAEWCPTCRRELPVVDRLASEYGDSVDFVAPAWKGTEEATAERATEYFRSGKVKWGLDAEEEVFQLYGVPYQPVTVLIASDGTVLDSWPGIRGEEQMRSGIEELISLAN